MHQETIQLIQVLERTVSPGKYNEGCLVRLPIIIHVICTLVYQLDIVQKAFKSRENIH